jgi:hypothetical protein
MVKRTKRFFEGDGVSDSDSNSGMKEERDRIDAEAAAEKAEAGMTRSYKPEAGMMEKEPEANFKHTPKATPKPAPETSSLRRVGREAAESAISKASEPSSVRRLSREEGESIKKSSAPAKPDVTKMPVNDRIKKSIEDSVSSARSGSGKTDTRSVNERIRSSIRSTFGFAKGGKVSSASSRGDGIATKGKTRGRLC